MEFFTYYPGSFGEILQGKIDDKDFLLSSPINIYTKVRLFECENGHMKFKNSKSNAFLINILKSWGYENYKDNIDFEINSRISCGKGLASSTADLCGVYHCLLKMFKRQFDERELIEQCIKIEPTDSIIFKKMTLFDYKNGLYKRELGDYFSYNILAFEGNNIVDTLEFNNKALTNLSNVEDLLPLLREAVEERNLEKLAYVSTESIVRNQKRLYYDFLKLVLDIKVKTSGLGIIGAHSGNVLGIVYEDYDKLSYAKNVYSNIDKCKVYSVKTLDSSNNWLGVEALQ